MDDKNRDPTGATDQPPWSPINPAVHSETLLDADGRRRAVMLRHPTYPFVREAASDDQTELQGIAQKYLDLVLPHAWPDARQVPLTRVGEGLAFTWIGDAKKSLIGNPPEQLLGSFWVERRYGSKQPIDRTLMLIAGVSIVSADNELVFGGQVGVRVGLHLAKARTTGHWTVRIAGFSACNLDRFRPATAAPARSYDAWIKKRAAVSLRVAKALGAHAIELSGLLPEQQARAVVLHIHGVGSRRLNERDVAFAWSGRLRGNALELDSTAELVSHVTAPIVTAFKRDPASCGGAGTLAQRAPTRADALLNVYRTPRLALVGDLHVATHAVLDRSVLDVPALPPPPAPPGSGIQPAPLSDPGLRTDELAAVHAFMRASELFARLDAYGLPASLNFRHLKLPLKLRHRPVLPEAPSGDAVNARVMVVPTGQGISATGLVTKAEIEVQFGAATLTHRYFGPALPGPSGRAEYLGLAADPHWAWHEFGHVLIYAATGMLEFPFAHSMGDALAAIVCAPDSEIGADTPQAGLTFPWAMTTRRHDRKAERGWCWCGRRNALRLAPAPRLGELRHNEAYNEEQMLSSSLFRAYQALGGATYANNPAGAVAAADAIRRRASDYCVYLVMRATLLLGPWSVTPTATVDQFVSALVDADIATNGTWQIQAPWPDPRAPRHVSRPGACAHKVLRWAFEQQGLFAAPAAGGFHEGVGKPPRVDIYVPGWGGGMGANPPGPRAEGGYTPVSLLWSSPDWKTDGATIYAEPGGIAVKVRNRGLEESPEGDLRLWLSDDTTPLSWSAYPLHAKVLKIGPRGEYTVHVALPAGTKPGPNQLALVEVSCRGDYANSDPLAQLMATPWPATDRNTLVDIVAGDNNLALAYLDL